MIILNSRIAKQNTAIKRTLIALCVCALLLCAFSAYADTISPLDPVRGTSLTVELSHEGTAIVGASFSVYRVGNIDENAVLTPDAPFSALNLSDPKSRSDWDQFARDMAAICKEQQTEPLQTGQTDADGRVCFGEGGTLSAGLYLVVGEDCVYRGVRYTSLPFLVTMPSWNAETADWDYEVLARPKLEAEPKATPSPSPTPHPTPTPSPTPSSDDPHLPQTGLLWWPIPPLLIIGVILILIGFLQRKKD